ncbi:hypothetical protein BGZ76_005372 [Entomortierella beljakovae]|nr:hypothetical protein BGZ76_005372 [Entomortierella beljakovae]
MTKTKITPTGVVCEICGKLFDDAKSLRNHKKEYHPSIVTVYVVGKEGNTSPVKLKPVDGLFDCPVCDRKGIQCRSGIIAHTKIHLAESKDEEDSKNECHICHDKFTTAIDLDAHYDTHNTTEELLDDSLDKDLTDAGTLRQAKIELDSMTRNTATSNFIFDIMHPYIAKYESGATGLHLLTEASNKRPPSDRIIELTPVKKPRTQNRTDPRNIGVLLASNRYGELIDLDKYEALEPSFFLLEYSLHMENIARNLAGAMIQTGSQVILVLKAEVYGRSPTEDPHFIDLVQPSIDVKKISVIRHEKTDKLIIGTLKWSALITSCIDLTTGEIEVGAHNRFTQTAADFMVWGNKEWKINLVTERQLRSKFHREETYMKSASIYFQFAHWTCVPTTIFNIYNLYDKNKTESGVKSASLLFYKIISSRSRTVKRKHLEKLLENDSFKDGTRAKKAITELLNLIPPDKDKIKLIGNFDTSNPLRLLADCLCSTIASKNKKKVKPAILTRAEKILQDKI